MLNYSLFYNTHSIISASNIAALSILLASHYAGYIEAASTAEIYLANPRRNAKTSPPSSFYLSDPFKPIRNLSGNVCGCV